MVFKIKLFFKLIDIEHTLFGLPFAYLGAFLSIKAVPAIGQLFWITVAMVSARTTALCLNRLIDRKIDRANPRTKDWILPQNKLPGSIIWGVAFLMLTLLLTASWQLNPLCFALSPVAVLFLAGYSFTKRFTWLCHLILGMAVGMGPVGGWFGVTGSFSILPFFLSAVVASWVAGFDTIYACQDIKFDRSYGLYSIPARFGAVWALRLAAFFHFGTVFFLLLSGLSLQLGIWYYVGVVFTAGILVYEHSLISAYDMGQVKKASFQINHLVGSIIFLFTIIDLFL